jgi:hypothetical protein
MIFIYFYVEKVEKNTHSKTKAEDIEKNKHIFGILKDFDELFN